MLWPVAFEREVGVAPIPITLRGERRVLWRTPAGIACVDDVCPHRRASLSTGRVASDGTIECSYHGWTFKSDGRCTRVPQLPRDKKIPKACNARAHEVLVEDGVVWVTHQDGQLAGTPTSIFVNAGPFDIVTDKSFVMPYPYELQLENILDIAHINVVHAGFQGDRARISPIHASDVQESDSTMTAYFVHESDTPDVRITLLKPGAVVVDVIDRVSKTCMRQNVIYASPRTHDSCTVLFRDVCPRGAATYDPVLYKMMNRMIIDRVFEQDIVAIFGQSVNMRGGELDPYVMPAECDVLIRMFQKWWRNCKL